MTQHRIPVPTIGLQDTLTMSFHAADQLIAYLSEHHPNASATAEFIVLERAKRAAHPYPRFGAFHVSSTLTRSILDLVPADVRVPLCSFCQQRPVDSGGDTCEKCLDVQLERN